MIITGPLLKKFSSYNHETWRLKFIWKHFKVFVTCTSTLAWQPSFESNFFSKICIFSTKKVLFFFLLIEFLVHLIKHYFINTLSGSLVPPWLRSCAWQTFVTSSSDLTPEPPRKYSDHFQPHLFQEYLEEIFFGILLKGSRTEQ